jgi:hypothetical protein
VEASFARAIQDHLELQRRNRRLESSMPIDAYRDQRLVDGHSLFRREDVARREEATLREDWPTQEREPLFPQSAEELWSSEPAFDWGD